MRRDLPCLDKGDRTKGERDTVLEDFDETTLDRGGDLPLFQVQLSFLATGFRNEDGFRVGERATRSVASESLGDEAGRWTTG